jgi:hypothetical protein
MSPRKIMSLTTSTFYWSIVHTVQYILIASSCTILPFTFLPCLRNTPTSSGYDMVVFGVIYLQSKYIPRVPQCLSTRPNWDPPPPPGTKGRGHTRLRVRGWGSYFRRLFGGEKAEHSVYSVGIPNNCAKNICTGNI